MSNYFKYFPTVTIPGAGEAKNITARVGLRGSKDALLDFNMGQHQRVDQIAQKYYGDDTFDWLVYFANDVVDPYYDMPLSEDQLMASIASKYGSLETAGQTIAFWQNNWYEDDSILSPSTFYSLNPQVKPFYEVQLDINDQPAGYTRSRDLIVKTTNLIVTYQLAASFSALRGDLITFMNGGTEVGRATVISAGETLTAQHVIDQYTTITHVRHREGTDVVAVQSIIQETPSISLLEAPYFDPISAYQAAVMANEARAQMKVVSNTSAETLRTLLRRVLK